MSKTKIQIEVKKCDICEKNNHEYELKFALIHRNLRDLNIDICENCNDKYQIKFIDEPEKQLNSKHLKLGLYATKKIKL